MKGEPILKNLFPYYCRADDSRFHFAAADIWADLHCQDLRS